MDYPRARPLEPFFLDFFHMARAVIYYRADSPAKNNFSVILPLQFP